MSDDRKTKGGPTAFDRALGGRLRRLRLNRNLSQDELAKALGISFQQLQKYESGANRMPASRLKKTADILNSPVSYFFDSIRTDAGKRQEMTRKFIVAVDEAYIILKGANEDLATVVKDMEALRPQLVAFGEGEEDPDKPG